MCMTNIYKNNIVPGSVRGTLVFFFFLAFSFAKIKKKNNSINTEMNQAE